MNSIRERIQAVSTEELRDVFRSECHPKFARDPDIKAATIAGLEAVRRRLLQEIHTEENQ